jgi:hypothetical protein
MLRGLVAITGLAALALVAGELGTYTPAERRHWSFQPRKQVEPPRLTNPWVRTPIDAFILARLQQEGIKPAPKASRRTLIRRVYFDLLGVPPAPADVESFVNDPSPKAYEMLVERLLANPQYGERQAQRWLDLVRFGESDGFEYDTHRPDAWRYRDYVIRSFNSDKPYNQFVREQLAGDEMAPKDEEMRVAAGFNRLGAVRRNAGNQEVASSRNEVLTEMTNVVGSALLGVTLGCARCHDHKFDPIRHTDYYRMQAFFAATYDDDIPLTSEAEQKAWKEKQAAVQSEMKALQKSMKGLEGDALAAMEKKLKEVAERMPEPLAALHSVHNDAAKATPIHVLARGDWLNKGQSVGMRPLGILVGDATGELKTAAPRTALAEWLLDPTHPLTARVIVNRIWGGHFGRAIVATPNDFGRMGARPTHPELLDYLANRLVDSDWRLKPLHRDILLSNAYQQDSRTPYEAAGHEKDPDNALLWKFSRHRLEAEEIRDAMLSVAGVLNRKQGGPSVIVPVDPELVSLLYKPSQWAIAKDENEHNRRTIYLLAKRNLHLPFMEVFDAPDLQTSCPQRQSSTHAPQALELLNGDLSNRLGIALAARLDRQAPTAAKQVDLAYQLIAGRAPTPKERQIALAFLRNNPLREFALAMLNLNDFLYVN